MTVTFNHTIIAAKDRHESARFFRELLELPEAPSWGPFINIQLHDGVLPTCGARVVGSRGQPSLGRYRDPGLWPLSVTRR